MQTDQEILNRYQQKKNAFSQIAPISLLGHSLFDMWDDLPNGTPPIAGKKVANLGISGVNTDQYLRLLVQSQRIQQLGDDVFVFLGVNDIATEPNYSPEQVCDWLNTLFTKLKQISPQSRYYLLEATPVLHRNSVDNATILAFNHVVENNCPSEITYIKTWHAFADTDNNLDSSLSTDGLHFSAKGYAVLQRLLEAHL